MGLFDSYRKKSLVKKGFELTEREDYPSKWYTDEILKLVDEALRLDPDYALAWSLRGAAFTDSGNPNEGITCMDNALRFDPENSLFWFGKGAVLQDLGRFEEAIDCYNTHWERGFKTLIFYIGRVMLLKWIQRYQEASETFEESLNFDPDNLKGWNYKRRCINPPQ